MRKSFAVFLLAVVVSALCGGQSQAAMIDLRVSVSANGGSYGSYNSGSSGYYGGSRYSNGSSGYYGNTGGYGNQQYGGYAGIGTGYVAPTYHLGQYVYGGRNGTSYQAPSSYTGGRYSAYTNGYGSYNSGSSGYYGGSRYSNGSSGYYGNTGGFCSSGYSGGGYGNYSYQRPRSYCPPPAVIVWVPRIVYQQSCGQSYYRQPSSCGCGNRSW